MTNFSKKFRNFQSNFFSTLVMLGIGVYIISPSTIKKINNYITEKYIAPTVNKALTKTLDYATYLNQKDLLSQSIFVSLDTLYVGKEKQIVLTNFLNETGICFDCQVLGLSEKKIGESTKINLKGFLTIYKGTESIEKNIENTRIHESAHVYYNNYGGKNMGGVQSETFAYLIPLLAGNFIEAYKLIHTNAVSADKSFGTTACKKIYSYIKTDSDTTYIEDTILKGKELLENEFEIPKNAKIEFKQGIYMTAELAKMLTD